MELRATTRPRSTLDSGTAPDRTTGHAVPTRAYQSDRRVDTSRRALPAQQKSPHTRAHFAMPLDKNPLHISSIRLMSN
jgi:hypothetical protein